jgi:hypothetical protein
MKRSFQKQLPKIISFLSSMIFLALFSSCGGKQGETVAKVQIFQGVAQLAVNNATGGLVLWGKNDRGDHFSRVIDSSNGTVELTLRNGTWVFSSMAWDNPNYKFEGTVRCGITQPTQLIGADLNLNFNLTNATCNQAPFLGSGTMNVSSGPIYQFPKFRPFNCQSLPSSPSSATTCDDTPFVTNRGHIGSYRVEVRSFDFMAGNFSPRYGLLQSRCMKVDPTGNLNNSMATWDGVNAVELNLPIGNGTIQLAFRIVGFYGNENCDQTAGSGRGSKEFIFDRGLGINNSQVAFWTTPLPLPPATPPSTYYSFVFLKSTDTEVCYGNNLSTTFAAGSGSVTNPYVICTPAQFNNIGSTYIANHYRIGKDLDFQFGSFNPVGGTSSVSNPSAFSRNFLGNGHSISNIKFVVPSAHTQYGLVRAMDSGAVVNNLTIQNISIVGHSTADYLGGIVGKISHSLAANVALSNIFVLDSKITGRDHLGLIFGYGDGTSSEHIHGIGNVNGRKYVGGLIGTLFNSSNITYASFKGEVEAIDQKAGGVIGWLNTPSGTLDQMRSEGRVVALTSVGGLIGHIATGGITVQNSYSISSVFGRDPTTSHAGGLIGQGASGSTLQKSFHTLGAIVGPSGSRGGCIGTDNSLSLINNFFTGPNEGVCLNKSLTHIRSNSITNSGISPSLGNITNNSLASGFTWFKASGDDGKDFPQLFWEKSLENTKLPYLKRVCSGLYTGQSRAGSGTLSSPKSVCDGAQFANMAADGSNYYILKTDIDLYDQLNSSSSKIATMNFSLDGDNHIVTNMKTTTSSISSQGNVGYFGQLNSGKFIKHLKLYGLSFAWTSTIGTSATTYSLIGALIGLNSGTVQNVFVDGLDFSFQGPVLLGNNQQYKMGALIGSNDSTGVIRSTKSFGNLLLNSDFGTPFDNSNLFLGGLAGYNNGLIEKSEEGIFISRTAGSGEFGLSQNIGGVAGKNSGTISEVKSGAHIK